MELMGYPFVALNILIWVGSVLFSMLFLGYAAVRFGQCFWNRVTGRTTFTGCLFSTGAQDPTDI